MREMIDKTLKLGIKACMLTGVAFTMTACYGTPPERFYGENPDFQDAQQKTEQQLHEAATENSAVAGESEAE